jgi:hypothetical protein
MKRLVYFIFISFLISCSKNRQKEDISNIINNDIISSHNQKFNYLKFKNSDVTINLAHGSRYRLKSTSILKFHDYVKSDFSLNFPPLSVLSLDLNNQTISSKSSFDQLNFSYPSKDLFVETFQLVLLGQIPPLYKFMGKKDFDYNKSLSYRDSTLLFSLFDSSSVASYRINVDSFKLVNDMSLRYKDLTLDVSYSNYSVYENLMIPTIININFVSKDYDVNAYIKRRDILLLDSI